MERTTEFLRMLLDSIEGGGQVVTFQDQDVEELKDLLSELEDEEKEGL